MGRDNGVLRLGIAGIGVLVTSWAMAGADKPFPYDPVCPWGRLSNGRGFMLRCLTEKEAVDLGAPRRPGIPPTPAPTENESVPLEVQLGPVKAEQGEFPEAIKSLSKANDRYVECVEKNDGLAAASGKVDVKFLVRGRGRAEGSTVKSVSGMSRKAAQCIADVVDRRFVGYPQAEMVGAVLTVTVHKKSK